MNRSRYIVVAGWLRYDVIDVDRAPLPASIFVCARGFDTAAMDAARIEAEHLCALLNRDDEMRVAVDSAAKGKA